MSFAGNFNKQLNSSRHDLKQKGKVCIFCLSSPEKETFRSKRGCLMSVCMLLCVSSERENKIIYIFFRKMKAVLLLRKMTVANKESHTKEMISKSDSSRHLHSLPYSQVFVSQLQYEKKKIRTAFQGGKVEDSVQKTHVSLYKYTKWKQIFITCNGRNCLLIECYLFM